jgi:glycosyltransferase involved in cell wall biosynthesis
VRRILLFVTDLEIGGTPTVVRELAMRLREPGRVEVEVACLKGWGPVADQLKSAGIEVTPFSVRRPWQARSAARRLRELIRQRNTDTVLSFLVHANVVAAIASRNLPDVRFLQSMQTVQPRPRWHWWAQRWAHRRAERIVVPSTAIVQAARERSGIPESKFVVIPNAVDPAEFPRVDVFTRPKIRAGYLGRLDPAKGYGTLIFDLEMSGLPNAELHYFGTGQDPAPVLRLAEKLGLGGRVHFHGAVVRPQEALSQMDVLWLPSVVEGFGLVLIEAMASGVPVVACAAGGVTDVVIHEQNGLLDTATRGRVFAESLRRLRDDSNLRRNLIENGLRTVREKFSWDVVLPQYKALLGL